MQSNQLKYDAYFELFPKDARHDEILRSVLAECFEASRYVILEKMLRAAGEADDKLVASTQELAERYNQLVTEGAKTCPECRNKVTSLRTVPGRCSEPNSTSIRLGMDLWGFFPKIISCGTM